MVDQAFQVASWVPVPEGGARQKRSTSGYCSMTWLCCCSQNLCTAEAIIQVHEGIRPSESPPCSQYLHPAPYASPWATVSCRPFVCSLCENLTATKPLDTVFFTV